MAANVSLKISSTLRIAFESNFLFFLMCVGIVLVKLLDSMDTGSTVDGIGVWGQVIAKHLPCKKVKGKRTASAEKDNVENCDGGDCIRDVTYLAV